VNVDQRDYVKAAGDTAGLRLTVHSADRLSFPEVEGLTISAGHTTSIRLRKVVTNALCLVIITLTAVWERSIVISVSVCLSVCPVRYLGNHTSKLCRILCACCLWPWLSSTLVALRCELQSERDRRKRKRDGLNDNIIITQLVNSANSSNFSQLCW